MRKSNPDSRIEVWESDYVNRIYRALKDVNADIIQIEPGSKEDHYIVEVVDRNAD